MTELIKKTSLHSWHVSHKGSMAEFGGYEMPLWYSSARAEHLAVLTSAGIFDTSHMALLRVEGQDAYALLQLCFTNNLDACVGVRAKNRFRRAGASMVPFSMKRAKSSTTPSSTCLRQTAIWQ